MVAHQSVYISLSIHVLLHILFTVSSGRAIGMMERRKVIADAYLHCPVHHRVFVISRAHCMNYAGGNFAEIPHLRYCGPMVFILRRLTVHGS